MVKNPPANAGNMGDTGSIPGWGRFPWRRKWQPTPAFLPGESQGQGSLVGYSPWGHKESGTTEQLNNRRRRKSRRSHLCKTLPLVTLGTKQGRPEATGRQCSAHKQASPPAPERRTSNTHTDRMLLLCFKTKGSLGKGGQQ